MHYIGAIPFSSERFGVPRGAGRPPREGQRETGAGQLLAGMLPHTPILTATHEHPECDHPTDSRRLAKYSVKCVQRNLDDVAVFISSTTAVFPTSLLSC